MFTHVKKKRDVERTIQTFIMYHDKLSLYFLDTLPLSSRDYIRNTLHFVCCKFCFYSSQARDITSRAIDTKFDTTLSKWGQKGKRFNFTNQKTEVLVETIFLPPDYRLKCSNKYIFFKVKCFRIYLITVRTVMQKFNCNRLSK